MAISRIQGASANATSVSISTPTTGDLIVVFAYRSATTAPTLATGFTSINTASANSSSFRCGYKVSDGTETTSGTWTNATSVVCHVYRGAKVAASWKLPVGTFNNSSGTTTALTYPFIGTQRLDNTSWIAVFCGISADQTWTAPTNTTTVTSTTRALGADTNTTAVAWPNTAVTATASGNWKSSVIEIIADSSSDTGIVFDKMTLGTAVTSGTSETVNHTVTSGLPNAVVVLVAWFQDGATMSSATYNSVSMTNLWNVRETILGNSATAGWVVALGTGDGASHAGVATWGFTVAGSANVAILSFGNVDQTTMARSATTGQFDSTGNSPAITVTAANALNTDVVITGLAVTDTTAALVSAACAYAYTLNIGGNAYSGVSSGKLATGSTAMAYTVKAAETIAMLAVAPLINASTSTTSTPGAGIELLTGRANILGFGIGLPGVP